MLERVAKKFGHQLSLSEGLLGGIAIHKTGTPLPQETVDLALKADATFLGAVGLPEFDNVAPEKRPEHGCSAFARPWACSPTCGRCAATTPCSIRRRLKNHLVDGADMIIVRELTGGLYYGTPRGITGEGADERGVNTMSYTRAGDRARRPHGVPPGAQPPQEGDQRRQIERARNFAALAQSGHRSRGEFPDVALDHLLVDNCAMQLVLNPRRFDVVLTENMFGDILSDEGAVLAGSIGMLPSASIGDRSRPACGSVCTNRCTARRPISRDKTKPIRLAPSDRSPPCSNTASD